MKRLLKIEILKNLSYRPFKIFSLIYLGAVVILALVGFAEFNLGFLRFKLKDIGIYNFPNVWHFTAYIISLLKIFLAAIIVFSISQEFSNRMFKQNVIDGLSKREFLSSKLLTIGVFSGLSTALVMLLALLLGLKYSTDYSSSDMFSEVYFAMLYFVKLFLFLTMFLFLTVLFKNAIFPFLTVFILWIIEGVFHASSSLEKIADFLPLTTILRVLEAPFNRISFNMDAANNSNLYTIKAASDLPWLALGISLIYIAVFIWATHELLKKRDW